MAGEVVGRPEQVVAVQPDAVETRADVGQDLDGQPALADPDDLACGVPPAGAAHAATVMARSGRRRNGARYAGRFENGRTSGCSSIPSRSAMKARRASIRDQASG